MGYSGGTKPNPTYHSLGDHTETVEIVYDPTIISYGQLLDIFWHAHHPGQPAWARQYKAVIFYHDPHQKELALKTKEQAAARLKSPVYTEILPAGPFYPAEGYHQKYYLRQMPELLAALGAVYPAPADLTASTLAARLNGFAAGYGTLATLKTELNELHLSATKRQRLLDLAAAKTRSHAGLGCPVPRPGAP